MVLATHQALLLRGRSGELDPADLPAGVRGFAEEVSPRFDFLEEDRRLDRVLRCTVDAIRAKAWFLYQQHDIR